MRGTSLRKVPDAIWRGSFKIRMTVKVPVPPLNIQNGFGRLLVWFGPLKAKHTAIRKANTVLRSATLARAFPTPS